MMIHRLQPFPTSGTREERPRQPEAEPEGGPRLRPEDAKFFRSWFLYDSGLKTIPPRGRFNWSLVAGLGLATTVSVGFWVGVGLVIVRFWK
ncbi:MAG: hypothetical protein ABSF72_08210 [Candidatus Sulfotelmatobacter sp.]|jgi:hypothetical protein